RNLLARLPLLGDLILGCDAECADRALRSRGVRRRRAVAALSAYHRAWNSSCHLGRGLALDNLDYQRLREHLADDATRSVRCDDAVPRAGLLWDAESTDRRSIGGFGGDVADLRDAGADCREAAARRLTSMQLAVSMHCNVFH